MKYAVLTGSCSRARTRSATTLLCAMAWSVCIAATGSSPGACVIISRVVAW